MDSQEDIFATQTATKSKVNYAYIVLCDKDEDVRNPFGWYPRSMFSSREILDRWLNSILDHSSRLKSLDTLQRLNDKSLSLFGKVEEGIFNFMTFLHFFSFPSNYPFNPRTRKWLIYIYIYIKNKLCTVGVPKEEVDAKVDSLNIQYNRMRSSGETQVSSLLSLVAKNPYRLISRKTSNKVCKISVQVIGGH